MTYFISIDEIKQNNVINANVDSEYIEPALREAQDIFLREILGDALYNAIENRINSNNLTGKYATLVNQYIKPYLENRMLASLVVPISMKIRNAGVIQQYDQGFSQSSVKDVTYLADYYNGRVEFYGNRMTEYLTKNIDSIPEWRYSDQNITNPTVSQNVSTIYLGGGRKRPCGANYGGSGGGTLNTVDWDDITNRPDFAQVSFSGDYNDLDNAPEIPEVSDAIVDFYQNGRCVGSFSLNQNDEAEINLDGYPEGYLTQDTVKTYNSAEWDTRGTMSDLISEITDDQTATVGRSYLVRLETEDMPAGLYLPMARVDIEAVYSDGEDGVVKDILFTIISEQYGDGCLYVYHSVGSEIGNWVDLNSSSSPDWDDIANKPNFATVATSGSYSDLQDKPSIPAPQVQADWQQNDSTQPDYIKHRPSMPSAQVQADWNQNDSNEVDYIKNKPSIPAAPVQSDWNEADNTSLAYIQNKPTIPAAQVNADWNAVSGVAEILNKPTIPAAPVQSDWNEADNTSLAYIKNKPSIPVVPSYTTETWTFTLQDNTTVTKTVYLVP